MRSRLFSSIGLTLALACDSSPKPAADPSPSESTPAVDGKTPEAAPTPCDSSKVTALAKALVAASDEARFDMVAKDLAGACTLPKAVTQFIAATAPRTADARGVFELDRDAFAAALAHVCPDADAVQDKLKDAPAKRRADLLYTGCRFERFGLVPRKHYARLTEMAPMALYAHQWLTDQGIESPTTEPIAKALLMRAEPQLNTAGQTLAVVAQPLDAAPDGIVVHATRSELRVGDKTIVSLTEDLAIDPASIDAHVISGLLEHLVEDVGQLEGPTATLVLVADAALPYPTIVDILYTAARAKVRSFAVVAQGPGRQHGAIPLHLPRVATVTVGADEAPGLSVVVTDTGFSVGVAGEAERETIGKTPEAAW
ncbi:MAG: hypothetical protein AAF721_42050, partial [Myxococcota bacterium]